MANEEKEKEGIQDGSNDKIEKLADVLSKLTIVEALDLCRAMEKLGFEPLVQQASVQAAAPTPAEAPAEETEKSFNLVLKEIDAKTRVQAMKLGRDLFGLDLIKVRELFATPGSTLATNVSKKDADSYIQQFASAGATVVAE